MQSNSVCACRLDIWSTHCRSPVQPVTRVPASESVSQSVTQLIRSINVQLLRSVCANNEIHSEELMFTHSDGLCNRWIQGSILHTFIQSLALLTSGSGNVYLCVSPTLHGESIQSSLRRSVDRWIRCKFNLVENLTWNINSILFLSDSRRVGVDSESKD